jgi:hypothetical protein
LILAGGYKKDQKNRGQMSHFIDKLKQASRTTTQPMGFRKEKILSKPRLILVARLSSINSDIPAEHLAGADAGLLNIKQNSEIKTIKEIKSIKNIPWGIWLNGISNIGIKKVLEIGYDFIAVPFEMQLLATGIEGIGRVIVVEASLERDLLKALDKLPIDAIIIDDQQLKMGTFTWRHLLLFKRFANTSNKPLLVPVSSDITSDELQAIWEAGVSGIIIEATTEQSLDEIKKLSNMIDSLALPLKSKWTKMQAIVPKLREEVTPISDEEDEEY